jgi:hypothetical protein
MFLSSMSLNNPTQENAVMRRILTLTILSLTGFCLPVHAANLNIGGLTQAQFQALSEDLGAALSYKPLQPAEPLGLFGFDIGVAATDTKLENSADYAAAFSGSSLVVPTVRAYLGLPLNFDVGVIYGAVPDSNIELWGGELRYALIPGGTATPAVALRASYTSLTGVDTLKLDTTSVDLSISKGFALFTPYAGIGYVWVQSTPQGVPSLTAYDFSMSKYFVGLNMNFVFMNVALEADKTGGVPSYGIKLGFRF